MSSFEMKRMQSVLIVSLSIYQYRNQYSVLLKTVNELVKFFNFLHYIDQNPVQDWVVRMNREEAHYNGGKIYVPADGVRIYNFFYYLIFDFAPVVLSMIAVNLFKKHDLMFNENPYYTKQSD